MSITLGGITYQGFIDYDRRQLKAAPPAIWIDWLHHRLDLVLIRPLDAIFVPAAPHHTAVNTTDMTFFLAGTTLIACAIEGLGHFLTNSDEAGRSFREWIERYMTRWDNPPGIPGLKNWLWTDVRNGLAHQLGFKSGGVEGHSTQSVASVSADGQIEMNPDEFYADFKMSVAKYFADVRTDATLRVPFEARFRSTFLTP